MSREYLVISLLAPAAVAVWLGACSSSSSGTPAPVTTSDAGGQGDSGPTPSVSGTSEPAGVTVAGPKGVTYLKQGGSVEIEVTVGRSGPTGAVAVTVADLPAKVVATTETIPFGASTAKIKLVAEADAAQVVAKPKLVATPVGAKGQADFAFDLTVRGAPGALDTTFGTGGRVTFGTTAGARGVYVTKDGKILAWGNDGSEPTLARYLPDGKLDATFADNGLYKRKNTGAPPPTLYDAAAELGDGRIVLLTTRGSPSARAVLTRLSKDGAYDSSFGEQVLAANPGIGAAIRREPGGRLAVQYTSSAAMYTRLLEVDGIPSTATQMQCGDDLSGGVSALSSATEGLCFASAGSVERRTLATDATTAASADLGLELNPDAYYPGRFVVEAGGRVFAGGGSAPVSVVAMKASDLSVDTTFGTNGRASLFQGRSGFAAAMGGDLVVGGETGTAIAVARVLGSGALDPSFGAAGVSVLPSDGQTLLRLRGLSTMPDGRVVVAIVSIDSSASRLMRLWQ